MRSHDAVENVSGNTFFAAQKIGTCSKKTAASTTKSCARTVTAIVGLPSWNKPERLMVCSAAKSLSQILRQNRFQLGDGFPGPEFAVGHDGFFKRRVAWPVGFDGDLPDGTRDDGFGRVVVSRCCSLLLWLTTGMNLKDANVPYRLMRAKSLRNALKSVPACFDLQNIALSVALKSERQLRWKYLPIHFRARQGGKNSINYYKIATMGLIFLRDLRRINTNEDSHTWWRPRWARRRLAS